LTFTDPKKWSWPKDLLAKLLSLFFAIFLWYFVAGEDRVDMNVMIPVEIINLPRNLIISNQFKNQLEVTLSGPRSVIRGIDKTHVSRSIDLSDAKPGTLKIHNGLDSIPFPRGLTTLRIQPNNITLSLDQLGKSEIPIKASTIGKLPDNLVLDSIILQPPTLSITGPNTAFKDIKTLWTKPINLSKLKGSVDLQVSVNLTPELVELAGESVVSASVKIKEKIVKKEINAIPVSAKGLTANFYAKLNPAEITVKAQLPYGTTNNSKDLQKLFMAGLDVSNLGPGVYNLKPKITKQAQITVNMTIPETIEVTIWNKKTKKLFR